MEFIIEDGFEIRRGMEEEFQQWEMDNAERTRAAMPEGVEYIGTFVMPFGNDPEAGTWRTLTRLDSYAALDRLAEASKGDTELARIQREFLRFADFDRDTAKWRHDLLKSVIDATVIYSPPGE